MKSETEMIALGIIRNDETVSQEQLERIRKAFRSEPQTEPITTKEAMQLLNITNPTLRKLEREGKIHRLQRYTKQVYYSRAEIENLAYGTDATAEK